MPLRIKNSVMLTSPESAAHSSGVCPSLSGAAMSSCAMWAPWELLQQTKNSAQIRDGYTSFSVLKPPRIDFLSYATRDDNFCTILYPEIVEQRRATEASQHATTDLAHHSPHHLVHIVERPEVSPLRQHGEYIVARAVDDQRVRPFVQQGLKIAYNAKYSGR
jgi:hypothetical protein